MRYAGLKYNDIVDCPSGICVSYWCQGCPIHCKGCHNPQTWDFNGGKEIDRDELIKEIIEAISKNGIHRNFSVLGGEPLQQGEGLLSLLKEVRNKFLDKDIWLWTGYYLSELNDRQKEIVDLCDYIVDGRYEEDKRDLTLNFRGSSNQTIWEKKDGKFVKSSLN